MPLPVLVRPKLPDTIPDKVNCVPATLEVLLALIVTVPDKLLLPVEVESVPPLRVMASVPTVTFCRSNVAPLATVVPLATSPKPAALVIANVPAETVVAPVYVLMPDKVRTPAPDFAKAPVPLIAPEKVWASLRLKAKVLLLVMLPVMLPLVLPAPTCKVPAEIVVPPV